MVGRRHGGVLLVRVIGVFSPKTFTRQTKM